MRTKTVLVLTAIVWFGGANNTRAADEHPGLAIFKKGGCNECHSISAVGVEKEVKKKANATTPDAAATPPADAGAASETKKKKEAPDLSGAGIDHDAKWISAFINKEETLNGEKHEKRFKGTEADRRTVAMFLAGLKTKPKTEPTAAPESKKEGGK